MSGASSSSSSAPEFWLLKIPNFLHEQLEEARKAQEARAKEARNNSSDYYGGPAAHSKAAQQPVAQLLVGQAKNGVRPMKIVYTPPAAPLGAVSAPPTSTEFPLAPKPKSTMLVFGQDATILPLSVPVVDPSRPPMPQESYKLAGQVAFVADALPARSSGAFMASLKARLEAEQAKQHKTQFADESVNPANPMGGGLIPIKRKIDSFSTGGLTGRYAKTEKRTRLDDDALQAAILDFMSRPQNQYVTISNLEKSLSQPRSAVAEMVKKLCIRLDDGPNKGMYGLAPEYRLAGDASEEPVIIAANVNTMPHNNQQQGGAGLYGVKQEYGGVKRE